MLKYGLTADVLGDAEALVRLQPLERAMLAARARLLMQLLRHKGEFVDQASRAILSDLPNLELRQWANAVMTWVLPTCHLSTAPESLGRFDLPPVPLFAGINSFATSGSHLIRMFSTRSAGRALGSGGAKRRRADNQAWEGESKRRSITKVCFAFRDQGTYKRGADCEFHQVRGGECGASDSAGGKGGGGGHA